MSASSIVLERTFAAPVDKVWRALTDKDEMKSWYFDLSEFKAEKGFQFQFNGGKDGKSYLHLCEITEVIPRKKMTYSWRYDGYPGISYVTFELFDQGDKTLLRLTHTGTETFPDNPHFDRSSFLAGWNYIVNTSLSNYLEKTNTKV